MKSTKMPLPPWGQIKTNFCVAFHPSFFYLFFFPSLKGEVRGGGGGAKTKQLKPVLSDRAYKLLNMENGECKDLEYKGMYLYGDI